MKMMAAIMQKNCFLNTRTGRTCALGYLVQRGTELMEVTALQSDKKVNKNADLKTNA